MASNRHLGRIVAMQTLYELEVRGEIKDSTLDLDEVIARNIDRYSEVVDDKAFIETLIRGVYESSEELIKLIQPYAPEWPLEDIARVDRLILLIGTYELQHCDDIPTKVSINEAIELAKSFGSDSSSRFVNGVLGSINNHFEKTTKSRKKQSAKSTKKRETT